MLITIDTEAKYDRFDIAELLYLLSLYEGNEISKGTIEDCKIKGYIDEFGYITKRGRDVIESFQIHTNLSPNNSVAQNKSIKSLFNKYIVLADKLRELYPRGKKDGTNIQWRDSSSIIAKKLAYIAVNYNFTFTDEEAISATKKYIESFGDDRRYMQVLKYFIAKQVPQGDGTLEYKSEFMSYIEALRENPDDIQDDGVWDNTTIV